MLSRAIASATAAFFGRGFFSRAEKTRDLPRAHPPLIIVGRAEIFKFYRRFYGAATAIRTRAPVKIFNMAVRNCALAHHIQKITPRRDRARCLGCGFWNRAMISLRFVDFAGWAPAPGWGPAAAPPAGAGALRGRGRGCAVGRDGCGAPSIAVF